MSLRPGGATIAPWIARARVRTWMSGRGNSGLRPPGHGDPPEPVRSTWLRVPPGKEDPKLCAEKSGQVDRRQRRAQRIEQWAVASGAAGACLQRLSDLRGAGGAHEIGRASCRERVCQYV